MPSPAPWPHRRRQVLRFLNLGGSAQRHELSLASVRSAHAHVAPEEWAGRTREIVLPEHTSAMLAAAHDCSVARG
ncbi:MAG TPA: hypothetical protein VG994_13680, partial [Steroidobacteraceae bacterium]|nr:hypothetical protein [Steroidobacteraceae bacterium]